MFLMNANQLANASSKNNALFLFLGLMVVVFLLMPDQAHAGTGGGAFDDVWETLKDWTQGTLGRIVAGAMILVGVVGGIARQSLMAFAMGIGGGMGLYNSPTVVESIMSATLEHAEKVIPTVVQLSNGLGV
ncbi:TrbC/VirB2 family protein [Klebsiella pneumoniae]|uniref:TrbC/VirB2 family protein n=3 Tax=Gammaproteobacteria TaxID=1236 RepID=A0AAN4D3Z0_CITFR|nr:MULTISPECIES: TraA family conjugative transfer protein [Enterobacteriaceae]EBH8544576.1 conjugal transfer protein TraA [Salmonella enterica subsp. enterica serovar Oranienburg]ECM8277624.1 TrbC/VirB2 family protein [Salmonella enterica subsp. enterica serovar Infantis]EDV4946393.1 TrbC/VirB2 family protein [Salmonella enterica subsp. enterica]EKV4490343.1 TrbC/VirB2 family protein [Citrobacter freundii]ERF93799.1 conjugal transfer protein TraA [Salmonella enterica subsp. enterica serovar He